MRFAPIAALLLCSLPARAQSDTDLADGRTTFRGNCAFCHGLTGQGGRGPSLASGRFVHGSSNEEIKNVILSGVAGTTMPSFEFEKEELDRLVVFIHSLSGSAGHPQPVAGDPAKGRQVYQRSGCMGCHRIGAEGSLFGPELTRIGVGRSPAYIRESIVNPTADIPDEYKGVTAVTRDGERISGIRINEDTFSVQLRDPSQSFRMFKKDELRQVIHETKSLMPPYQSLAAEDLQNLLAYLDTLHGELSAGGEVKKEKGTR